MSIYKKRQTDGQTPIRNLYVYCAKSSTFGDKYTKHASKHFNTHTHTLWAWFVCPIEWALGECVVVVVAVSYAIFCSSFTLALVLSLPFQALKCVDTEFLRHPPLSTLLLPPWPSPIYSRIKYDLCLNQKQKPFTILSTISH